MASNNSSHQRVNSAPVQLHDWHAVQRSLSLTARMHANIQFPTSSAMADRDTGFPEPLSSDRNTTMRHPDADTSPNATIEADDIDAARTHQRFSFLRERNPIRSGKITVDTSFTTLTGADGRADSGYESGLAADKAEASRGGPILAEGGTFVDSPISSSSPNSMVKGMRHSEDLPLVLRKTRARSDSMEMRKRGFLGRLHSLRRESQGPKS